MDFIMIRVDNVEAAASYYVDVFGLRPRWSGDGSIGLGFPETDAEIVFHCDPKIPSSVEVYYLVDDVVAVVANYAVQGCQVLVSPFDITIGKCAVLQDPFGTRLCILDMTNGARRLNLAARRTKQIPGGGNQHLPEAHRNEKNGRGTEPGSPEHLNMRAGKRPQGAALESAEGASDSSPQGGRGGTLLSEAPCCRGNLSQRSSGT